MERDNSDKVVVYCAIIAIIAIIIIALCFAVGISMMDFSEMDKIDVSDTTSNVVKNNKVKNEENLISNSEEIIQPELKDKPDEEVENENDEESDVTEIREVEDEEQVTEEVKNPLAELKYLSSGEKMVISENRITYVTEDENVKTYFQFNEENKVEGLYYEMICQDENEAELFARQVYITYPSCKATVEGSTVIVEWPITDAIREYTKDQMLENVNNVDYVVEYE